MMLELRGAGGSGGNSTSTGARDRAARRQPVHGLQADRKTTTATTAIPIRIVFGRIGRRIVPRTD